ncbi:spermidine synthase-like protein [Trichloromonas sp.]|uniref:spermidine synthase-like protein n=1 Tax=Trichloromonas sp. TaxID=3069249 RepID=UPI002A3B7B5E|nr:class I SAM-dependent methyltransferase [Trichloromonas sp.]
MRRQLWALGLLSAALIALQPALMQSFAISQWHHFAYLVIAIALLGFGTAGTLLALSRPWALRHHTTLLPLLLFSCALAMALAAGRAPNLFGRFDSYLLPYEPLQALWLLAVILLLSLPFLLGALVIGILFMEQAERIGLTYFANLFGSGLGGLLGLALLSGFAPERLPALLALPVLFAGLLLLPSRHRPLQGLAVLSLAVIVVSLARPPELPLSQFKDLRRTLDLPEHRTVALRHDPYGQVQAVTSPALRFAPGLSLDYRGEIPQGDLLFSNGDTFGFVPRASYTESARLLNATPQGLPYALAGPDRVLILQAGTGLAAAQALNGGARQIVAIEPHRAALELLRASYPASAGDFFAHPKVRMLAAEPRTWLAADRDRYDLIVLPTIGTFGGGVGVTALHEQHLLTEEAFAELWSRLTPNGLLCLTTWLDHPPRVSLRLAATLIELLQSKGIADPNRHLAAARGWGTITFCLKRSPLTSVEVAKARSFCGQWSFDPLLLPGITAEERQNFHQLPDTALFTLLDGLLFGNRREIYRDYLFDLRPAGDERPFFSQFLRLKTIPHLHRLVGEGALPVVELGSLVLVVTLLLTTLAAGGLILLPLARIGRPSDGNRTATVGYFGALGLGYMLIEITLIHRFVLYLGHPVYAAAMVISTLLLASGLGSAASERLSRQRLTPRRAACAVVGLLGLYIGLLGPLLHATITLATAARVGLTLLILTPLGFCLGLPFPLGLGALHRRQPEAVPWAWGINGCLSVVGGSLATLIAILAGFNAVLFAAALAYALAGLSAENPSREIPTP